MGRTAGHAWRVCVRVTHRTLGRPAPPSLPRAPRFTEEFFWPVEATPERCPMLSYVTYVTYGIEKRGGGHGGSRMAGGADTGRACDT